MSKEEHEARSYRTVGCHLALIDRAERQPRFAQVSGTGAAIWFDNLTAGSQIRFVLRRGGRIIGTSPVSEWGIVVDQKVIVQFSLGGNPVQPQVGDTIRAEVIGEAPSNPIAVL